MFTVEELRRRIGIVVPVHFPPEVDRQTVQGVLLETFRQHRLFCPPERTVLVVDRDTAAERVLHSAGADSPLNGLPVLVLERNQGKTGAVRAGLRRILEQSDPPDFVATRDCDGDAALEDLGRLVNVAVELGGPAEPVAVFGVRSSLFKPMNWEREQWERLVNGVVEGMVDFALAGRERVQDRTFRAGFPLDLQAGFRVYSQEGARLAASVLERVPDDRELYLFACEILPYLEIALEGGRIGQAPRVTLADQPVSSFSRLPFARCYGRLLRFIALEWRLPVPAVRQLFDNTMVELAGYFSPLRESFLECRAVLDPEAPPPRVPGWI